MTTKTDTFNFQMAIQQVLDGHSDWSKWMPAYSADASLQVSSAQWQSVLKDFQERLKDNYPFFHPLYAGQMLKPPHPAAVVGYLAAMLINPNNHALDGGPATARMEKECVASFAKQFGFEQHLGHLTSGGTVANLEALWVARESHPQKKIAYGENAHYTHGRMSAVLGIETVKIPATPTGTMDVNALKETLQTGEIGTVVVTLGTTALGAIDPLAEILKLRKQFEFRIHVDMAYGGYYHVLNAEPAFAEFKNVKCADSVVIDPHKHGLQPYGCGCVIFSDPAVGKFYHHDSPYTYFTSDDLHLGEISLECSRPGAAAAALWLTMQLFPLTVDTGMGAILQQTRKAALDFAALIRESEEYELYLEPKLDIVTFFAKTESTAAISRKTRMLFHAAMQSVDYPVYLATLTVSAKDFSSLHPGIEVNSESVTIFRSCLMKPEHAEWAPRIFNYLQHHARVMT